MYLAWVSENCLCIAQQRVEDKSDEITAIPNILNSLDITDKEIADQIVSRSGHYFLSVKGTPKGLPKMWRMPSRHTKVMIKKKQ
jgi:hypothetical protein